MSTHTPPGPDDDLPMDQDPDPTDAGFPSSPELADGDTEFTDDDGEVRGSGAG
jgi:hypothetical protein